MILSVLIKAKKGQQHVGMSIGMSEDLIISSAGIDYVDLKKLTELTRAYLKKAGVKGATDIYLQCKKGAAITEEIHFIDWTDAEQVIKVKSALHLKEPQIAEEKKPEVKKDFPHEPDAKGICKHCFRHISKARLGMFCREAQQDYKDEHATDKRKKQMEQDADTDAFVRYKGTGVRS